MLRWPIVRTLLYKEILRYRYNWGLLVMMIALLALAGLVAISARMKKLPGQEGAGLDWCWIIYSKAKNPKAGELVSHLLRETKLPGAVYTDEVADVPVPDSLTIRANTIALIIVPPSRADVSATPGNEVWRAQFVFYGREPPPGMAIYRNWFISETYRFLNPTVRVEEELAGRKPASGIETTDRISLIETALILFALYLMAFNIYLTSTGEEREKRVLLALLLTPARPSEIIAAKGIFYATGSLVLSVAIMAMCHPAYLAAAPFWPTVLLGALAYLAIATVFLSLIRRQTTITMVSMLYLIGTTIIMILGDIPGMIPFLIMRVLLIEHYLHSLIYQIMSDQRGTNFGVNLVMLLVLTAVWSGIAVFVFARKGVTISQAR